MKDKATVKLALKSRRMTQTAFAEKLGYNGQNSVSMLLKEGHGKDMKTDTLIKALEILGYEVVVRDKFTGDTLAVLTNEDTPT